MYRRILMLVTAVIVGASVPGLGDQKTLEIATAPPDPLTVAVTPWPGSAGVYVAWEKGYFNEEGLAVALQTHASGHLALRAVLAGKADLATAGDPPIARAVLRGREIAVLATIAKTSRAIQIVCRKDRSIHGPEDLQGKAVGVVPGTTAHVFLQAYLTTSYIDPETLRIVHIPPDQVENMLLIGRVDAVSTWAPHTDRLKEKLGDNAVLLTDPSIYTMTWNLVGERGDAARNGERFQKFLRALVRANRFLAESPAEARELVSKRISPDIPVSEAEWEGLTLTAELDQSLILNLEEQARWMIEKGHSRKESPPNFLDVVHTAALQAVKPEAVHIPGK